MWAGGGNGREGMEGLDFHLIKSIENESVPHPLKKSFSKSSLIHKNIKNSPGPAPCIFSLQSGVGLTCLCGSMPAAWGNQVPARVQTLLGFFRSFVVFQWGPFGFLEEWKEERKLL